MEMVKHPRSYNENKKNDCEPKTIELCCRLTRSRLKNAVNDSTGQDDILPAVYTRIAPHRQSNILKICSLRIRNRLANIIESEALAFSNIRRHILNLFLTGGTQNCHYINGPETLPPPLTKEEELEVLENIRNDVPGAREPLITHNLRLVVYIAKKFESPGANVEDLISIGTIGLVKAVKTFSIERNIKLATYASRCIENEILMYLRKSSQLKHEISIDDPLNMDWDGNELLLSDLLGSDPDSINKNIEQEAEKAMLMEAIQKLPAREKEIMEMRFGLHSQKEHTQKEVADTLGISQSYISRLEKRIISRLRKELEKAG